MFVIVLAIVIINSPLWACNKIYRWQWTTQHIWKLHMFMSQQN